eukprot:6189953-Pleurochrysis_carterae.AAC.3
MKSTVKNRRAGVCPINRSKQCRSRLYSEDDRRACLELVVGEARVIRARSVRGARAERARAARRREEHALAPAQQQQQVVPRVVVDGRFVGADGEPQVGVDDGRGHDARHAHVSGEGGQHRERALRQVVVQLRRLLAPDAVRALCKLRQELISEAHPDRLVRLDVAAQKSVKRERNLNLPTIRGERTPSSVTVVSQPVLVRAACADCAVPRVLASADDLAGQEFRLGHRAFFALEALVLPVPPLPSLPASFAKPKSTLRIAAFLV